MTTIIGLMGPAGAGKSAAAAFLVDRYGARRYSLADPLKDMVKAAFDLTEAQVRGTQADKEAVDPRYGVSPRWLLQRIGTDGVGEAFWNGLPPEVQQRCIEVARILLEHRTLKAHDTGYIVECYVRGFRTVVGESVWSDLLCERICDEAPELAVVEDVRFVNEVTVIRAFGDPTGMHSWSDDGGGYIWRLHPVGESTSTDAGTHASETEWLRAPADVEIAPRERGLELLYSMLRTAAASCGLRPSTPL